MLRTIYYNGIYEQQAAGEEGGAALVFRVCVDSVVSLFTVWGERFLYARRKDRTDPVRTNKTLVPFSPALGRHFQLQNIVSVRFYTFRYSTRRFDDTRIAVDCRSGRIGVNNDNTTLRPFPNLTVCSCSKHLQHA